MAPCHRLGSVPLTCGRSALGRLRPALSIQGILLAPGNALRCSWSRIRLRRGDRAGTQDMPDGLQGLGGDRQGGVHGERTWYR